MSYVKDLEVLMITIIKRVKYAKTFVVILDMRHGYVAFWYMDLNTGLELELGHSYVTSASSYLMNLVNIHFFMVSLALLKSVLFQHSLVALSFNSLYNFTG